MKILRFGHVIAHQHDYHYCTVELPKVFSCVFFFFKASDDDKSIFRSKLLEAEFSVCSYLEF